MPDRRRFLALIAGVVLCAGGAQAQGWKAQYPDLVFAVVPAENASGVGDRYAAWVAYLARELGVKVTLRIANDYAAVIEGQKAGNIHIAYYGPASLSRAVKVTNGGVEPFVTTINQNGTVGY